MYPRAFSYVRAESEQDAVRRLAEHGEEASVLAGGMSLVPRMKYRERSPSVLVDVGRLRELAGVDVEGDRVRIGATTRHHELASWRDPGGDPSLAMLAELAETIGDPQVRNMGTIGGSLAAVEPTGDWCAALLALRGEVCARSVSGSRRIAADDLFLDSRRSALAPDELLTEAVITLPRSRHGAAHEKFEARAAAAALIACVVSLTLDGEDRIVEAGVATVGLLPYPMRLAEAEDVLRGRTPSAEAFAEAAAATGRATATAPAFRRSVTARLIRGAAARAAARALGREAQDAR